MVEAYVAGPFTGAELKAYRADVATRRQSVEAHRRELFGRRAAQQRTMGQTTVLVEYCARVREQLQTFSQEEKQRTFDALALRVVWVPKQPLRIETSLIVEASISPRRNP